VNILCYYLSCPNISECQSIKNVADLIKEGVIQKLTRNSQKISFFELKLCFYFWKIILNIILLKYGTVASLAEGYFIACTPVCIFKV